MRGLASCEEELDLNAYVVGYGPSEGTRLGAYIRNHMDKGTGVVASAPTDKPSVVPLTFTARLVEPYAVLVR